MPHIPRILTLDGGGVRGLSALMILWEIMDDIGHRSGAPQPPKPCQYFDLIGGTSTGGLIAIMLGLLSMVPYPGF
jgi:patatin-like phospholipase/acyl hydrolase